MSDKHKKAKVVYHIDGETRTTVIRYTGDSTAARERVIRNLKARGATSVTFMNYESYEPTDEAYMPDAIRKAIVYRAPPAKGEVVGHMKVRLARRHQDVMPGERVNPAYLKRLRHLTQKVLQKGHQKRPV